MRNIEALKNVLLYRKIVSYSSNCLTLDNGVVIYLEETEKDCCASSWGEFSNVELEAVITDVRLAESEFWNDGDTYGHRVKIIVLHNQNPVCEVNADADAGNGGYYYSVQSFVVHSLDNYYYIHCTGSDDLA